MKRNFWIKAAAVLLALVLWMFVMSRGQSSVSLEVPVVFQNVPPGLQVSGEKSRTVTVEVRGHERFIRDLRPGDVHVSLDMEGLKKGIRQYRITRANVKHPSTLRVVSISPSSLNVHAEETLKKTVRIMPVIAGEPLKGFRTSAVEVVPAEATVEGLVNEMRRMNTLETEPVDISSASETVVTEAKILKPDTSIKTDIEAVTVRVVIVKEE